jgi:hypothetical protein
VTMPPVSSADVYYCLAFLGRPRPFKVQPITCHAFPWDIIPVTCHARWSWSNFHKHAGSEVLLEPLVSLLGSANNLYNPLGPSLVSALLSSVPQVLSVYSNRFLG